MSSFLPAVFGENMMDLFDDFDRDFFRGFGRPERVLYGKNAARMMKTDVKETDEGYELAVDLPGFKKEEIHIELQNGYLTISTEKNLENKEEKEGKLLRQERYTGTMQRSFYVGQNLTEEDITAKYEDGVLKVDLPKKEGRGLGGSTRPENPHIIPHMHQYTCMPPAPPRRRPPRPSSAAGPFCSGSPRLHKPRRSW